MNFLSSGGRAHFFVLGSGDSEIAGGLHHLSHVYGDYVHFEEAYNEAMAHQLYAGSDYLIMPSQTETLWPESNVCHGIWHNPCCSWCGRIKGHGYSSGSRRKW